MPQVEKSHKLKNSMYKIIEYFIKVTPYSLYKVHMRH